jgi:hypothetical protein
MNLTMNRTARRIGTTVVALAAATALAAQPASASVYSTKSLTIQLPGFAVGDGALNGAGFLSKATIDWSLVTVGGALAWQPKLNAKLLSTTFCARVNLVENYSDGHSATGIGQDHCPTAATTTWVVGSTGKSGSDLVSATVQLQQQDLHGTYFTIAEVTRLP